MADNTRTSWDPFLFELRGKVHEVFPSEAPFLAEMSGFDAASQRVDRHSSVRRISRDMDGARDIFSGRRVRHTIILAGLQGGGNVSETGTWNVPHALASDEVHITLVRSLVPFSVTVDVERDSFDNANAVAVATLVQQARHALARLENLQMLGDGTGVQATITDTANTLTTTVSAATFNPDVLLPGTVWDILTSAGADTGQGLRRKIASVAESTRVITWDTASQASDGGSGNIDHANTDVICIPGSFSATAGELAGQGLEQAAAITGTFESIDKAAVPQWQGTDGRGGVTDSLPLSDQMLDAAVRRGRRAGIGVWDFGLGDPACIDLYKQGKAAQVKFEMQVTTLKSGFSGIVYDGADRPFPLIKEPMHEKLGIHLIEKASFQLYGDRVGPEFLEDDGGMFRRFSRTLPKEADLLDRWQMGVKSCNTIVFLGNLAAAS